MPDASLAGQEPIGAWRTIARLVGNVLLGVAVGLLGYYAVTNTVTARGQQQLKRGAPSLRRALTGPGEAGPVLIGEPEMLDFASWAEQDAVWWDERAQGKALARIVATRIGFDAYVVRGVRPADLKNGPGWIEYTQMPGPTGNCGISGHRTTYGAPFRHIDRLRAGDTIELYTPYRRYTYRVRSVFAVAPNRVDVVAPTEQPTLTLTACHPPYSARQRLIVQSDLVEVRRMDLAGTSVAP